MSTRPDLRLTAAERDAFLRAVVADGDEVAYAVRDADGYPSVGLCEVALEGDMLRLSGDRPVDGAAACVIVERGATYDDITAVIVRGVVRDRRIALDDVVSFAFGKLPPG